MPGRIRAPRKASAAKPRPPAAPAPARPGNRSRGHSAPGRCRPRVRRARPGLRPEAPAQRRLRQVGPPGQALLQHRNIRRRSALLRAVDRRRPVGPEQGIVHVAGQQHVHPGQVPQAGQVELAQPGQRGAAGRRPARRPRPAAVPPRAAIRPAPPSVVALPPSPSTMCRAPASSGGGDQLDRPRNSSRSAAGAAAGQPAEPARLGRLDDRHVAGPEIANAAVTGSPVGPLTRRSTRR